MRFDRGAAAFGLLGAALLAAGPVHALDKVSAAKAASSAWVLTVPDVGMQEGIFQKYGIEVEIGDVGGDAKVQQALTSNSVDFGISSGPAMAFIAKGAPQITVAAFASALRNGSMVVSADSPIKTVADLKGKTIGITTAGSLTEWLAKQVAIQEGWGTDGVKIAALGAFDANVAALRTHQIDGIVSTTEAGYLMEENNTGRILFGFDRYTPNFISEVIYARNALVKDKPDVVKRFLEGFFATIHFMKTNRDATVAIGSKLLNMSPAAMGKTYDYEISMFIDDGTFDPKALDVLKKSWIDLATLPSIPSNDQLLTTQFVPVKY